MNFNIIAVGRMKSGPLKTIWDEYQKRLKFLWKLIIKGLLAKLRLMMRNPKFYLYFVRFHIFW